MSIYTKKVLKYFRNPHNLGTISNADGTGKAGNPICGDVMKLYIKVKNNKISDIKFETLGCAAAIATSSVTTDLVKGKSLEKAEELKKEDIIKELGELPPSKLHCSILSVEALRSAIKNYREKQKK